MRLFILSLGFLLIGVFDEHRIQLLFSASRFKNKLDDNFFTCAYFPTFFNFAIISRCICGNDF